MTSRNNSILSPISTVSPTNTRVNFPRTRQNALRSPSATESGPPASPNATLNAWMDEDYNPFEHGKTAPKKRIQFDRMTSFGPTRYMNPTTVQMDVRVAQDDDSEGGLSRPVSLVWRSRDHRKGRNSMALPNPEDVSNEEPMHRHIRRSRIIRHNLWKMCTTFPYWDIAFWSGWAYTIGSILFVIDGAFSWVPDAYPSTEFPGEGNAAGWLFFVGALFYELGATMAYLEAVNDGSFQGSAMQRLLEGHENEQKKLVDQKLHNFFGHFVPYPRRRRRESDEEKREADVDPEAGWKMRDRAERPGSIYPMGKQPAPRRGGIDLGEAEKGELHEYVTWRWWPSWYCLRTHHVYEIGYLATAIQLFGATIYAQCGIVAIPYILDSLSQGQLNGAYWIPQVVASVCFVTASLLFTIETQSRWYKPEPTSIGWWIGAWAVVGSLGFLLSGILGIPYKNTGAIYQSDLSAMWGSAAFLFSSLLQWYEAINKNPVEELLNEKGEMKSYQIHPI